MRVVLEPHGGLPLIAWCDYDKVSWVVSAAPNRQNARDLAGQGAESRFSKSWR